MATTIKIPNPIPALNIPAIASHEFNNEINNGRIKRSVFDGFIAKILVELKMLNINSKIFGLYPKLLHQNRRMLYDFHIEKFVELW